MAASTSLTVMPAEKGLAKVTVSFVDENGDAVTPTAITWTLTDRSGNVINSRSAVSVTPDDTVTIVLSGSDLAITGNKAQRVLLIEATYNSDLGSNLPLKAQAFFTVAELVGVS